MSNTSTTNLSQLQQQIVSEAVKAFREKLKSILDMVDSGGFVLSEDSKIYIKDEASMVLTDQLTKATRKVAEETWIKCMEAEDSALDLPVDKIKEHLVDAANSWLNQDSEGNSNQLKGERDYVSPPLLSTTRK